MKIQFVAHTRPGNERRVDRVRDLPVPPREGETVHLDGHSYKVADVQWFVEDDDTPLWIRLQSLE